MSKFQIGDEVKLSDYYIKKDFSYDEFAKDLRFKITEIQGDIWYPFKAKLLNKNKHQAYSHIWYFRDDDIEYTDDYITPESLREYIRIMNNPLPRKTFWDKLFFWR